MLRSPKRHQRRATTGAGDPVDRDLSIADRAGRARYLGRPLYFGPFDPSAPAAFAAFRDELIAAEKRGVLTKVLGQGTVATKEQFWHIEASFLTHEPEPNASHIPGVANNNAGSTNDAGSTSNTNDADSTSNTNDADSTSNSDSTNNVSNANGRTHARATTRAPRDRCLPPTAGPRSRLSDGTPAPERVAVTKPPTEPPVSFEVFCEIAGAQAAWAAQGKSPLAAAMNHFLLDADELIGAELYWAAELARSRELARQFARRMLHYKDHFSDG